jgi:heme A synthase
MRTRFARYAWFVLVWNLAVIIWGAVVRATGAGAGCGEHWPLCNGQVIPPAPQVKTLIEYGHRVTSGLALLLVVGLVAYAFRVFPHKHLVRRASVIALVFELTEGLIGAALVLLGHVAANESVKRGYSLSMHLANTLLLLAALSITAWFATREPGPASAALNLKRILLLGAVGIIVIGISGAIAALGDTLFTASTLTEGIRQDFATGAHPFVRLRVLHPFLAVGLAVFLLSAVAYMFSSIKINSTARQLGIGLILITVAQLCLGAVNLVLMAPVPVQLIHLLLADLLWIAYVLLSAELLLPAANEPAIAGPQKPHAAGGGELLVGI